MVNRLQPAPGDFIPQGVVSVLLEALDRHPLQGRPAIGSIPLLAGFIFGSQNTARRQQAGFYRIRQAFRLLMGSHTDIQRHDAGGREERQLLTTPVVIAITAVFVIPQIAVDRHAAIACLLTEDLCRLFIPLRGRDIGDGALQLKQEGVKIDRDKLGGANTRQPSRIPQPARGVVPA